MSITAEQHQKIKLLDELLNSVDTTDMADFYQMEQIVLKLKGKTQTTETLMTLIHEHNRMEVDLAQARVELDSIKVDFQQLIKSLTSWVYTNEMQVLKQKYQAY